MSPLVRRWVRCPPPLRETIELSTTPAPSDQSPHLTHVFPRLFHCHGQRRRRAMQPNTTSGMQKDPNMWLWTKSCEVVLSEIDASLAFCGSMSVWLNNRLCMLKGSLAITPKRPIARLTSCLAKTETHCLARSCWKTLDAKTKSQRSSSV